MKSLLKTILILSCMALPECLSAQADPASVGGLQNVLDGLYNQMWPLCSQLVAVGRGLAGFAATWYIASRVWGHIARAEPIDFYPLFRPFVIGFAVLIFPSVISLLNGILSPTVTATNSMVNNSNTAISLLLRQKQLAIQNTVAWQMYDGQSGAGDQDKWYQYTHPGQSANPGGWMQGIGDDIKFAMAKASYNFRNSVKEWLSEVLLLLYEAAALCINTIRTFYLIVLAILGPLVFGLAVFDGLGHTLLIWVARYINVFLWLPVANIFGSIIAAIEQKMIALDIQQINQTGNTFFSSTDTAYLIFLIMGIVGYCTVPSVAGHIVNVGGGNALVDKVTSLFSSSVRQTTSTITGSSGMVSDSYGNGANRMGGNLTGYGASREYFHDKINGK